MCMKLLYCYFFFFSSRRRHTRFDCDWSSDVCSSDLAMRRLNSWRSSGTARGTSTRTRSSTPMRSEEHTSELQSQSNLVCRLLLEKKNKYLEDDLNKQHPLACHLRAYPDYDLCPADDS